MDDGNESRHTDCGRLLLAAEAYRTNGGPLHCRSESTSGRRCKVPARQCVSDAAIHGQTGHRGAYPTGWNNCSSKNGAELRHEFTAPNCAIGSPDRTGSNGESFSIYADSILDGRSQWNLERTENSNGPD